EDLVVVHRLRWIRRDCEVHAGIAGRGARGERDGDGDGGLHCWMQYSESWLPQVQSPSGSTVHPALVSLAKPAIAVPASDAFVQSLQKSPGSVEYDEPSSFVAVHASAPVPSTFPVSVVLIACASV